MCKYCEIEKFTEVSDHPLAEAEFKANDIPILRTSAKIAKDFKDGTYELILDGIIGMDEDLSVEKVVKIQYCPMCGRFLKDPPRE